MKRRRNAEEILSRLGASCQVLKTGQVLYLYSKDQVPDSVLSRAYSHVADDYKLYLVGERYLLEFREQCNQEVVYQALFLDSPPDPQRIGELFDSHTRIHGSSQVYVMTDFDQLPELGFRHRGDQNDPAMLKALMTFFGLTLTGLAMVGTENGRGEPTPPLSRVGLGLMGTGFLYLSHRLFGEEA
jgi:hypothetical protein